MVMTPKIAFLKEIIYMLYRNFAGIRTYNPLNTVFKDSNGHTILSRKPNGTSLPW